MVVIDSRNMVIEHNCGYTMGKPTQTAPRKKVTLTSETNKEHSEEYNRAVAILEARRQREGTYRNGSSHCGAARSIIWYQC